MVNNMGDVEETFLYNLMMTLYKMNAPIVFKGALVLKVIQYQCGNPSGLERETHDIDGDWVGNPPSMEFLTNILQRAVNMMGYDVVVVPYREYAKGKSAGFNFIRRGINDIFVTMDLSVKVNNFVQQYSYINGVTFYGQSINKIIVDKISVCASRFIFRRIKDVIDLYILSFCWTGFSSDLFELSRYSERPIDDLSRLINYYNELEHAYSKYSNKASVLPFNIVHSRVVNFLAPFITRQEGNYYWNGNTWVRQG